MKKFIFGIIILLICPMQATATNYDPLIQITSFIEKSNLEVANWEVVIKEKVPIQTANKTLTNLKKKHKVNKVYSKENTKYLFEVNSGQGIYKTYELIYGNNKSVEFVHINVIVNGDGWNEKVKKLYKSIEMSLNRYIFSKNSRSFVCVNTNNNAIIKSVNFLEDLYEELNTIHISTQSDSIVDSTYEQIVYGYSPQWKQNIAVNDQQINIQGVIKKTSNNETNVLIGTPILLNEY